MALSADILARLRLQMLEAPNCYDAVTLCNTLDSIVSTINEEGNGPEVQRSSSRSSSLWSSSSQRTLDSTTSTTSSSSSFPSSSFRAPAAEQPDPQILAEIKQLTQDCAGLEVQVRRYRASNAELEARATVAAEEAAAMQGAKRAARRGDTAGAGSSAAEQSISQQQQPQRRRQQQQQQRAGEGAGGDADVLPSAADTAALLAHIYALTKSD